MMIAILAVQITYMQDHSVLFDALRDLGVGVLFLADHDVTEFA